MPQLKPSSSIRMSRARFTAEAGAVRVRISDINVWRSSWLRSRIEVMAHDITTEMNVTVH